MYLRIVFHETSRNECRTGAAPTVGRGARAFGLYATGSSGFLRRPCAQRSTLDAGVSGARTERLEGHPCHGPTASAFGQAGTRGVALVSPVATGIRLSHRTVDRTTRGPIDSTQVPQGVSSALRQPVVGPASACPLSLARRKRLFAVAAGPTHAGALRKDSHPESPGEAAREGFDNRRPDNLDASAPRRHRVGTASGCTGEPFHVSM